MACSGDKCLVAPQPKPKTNEPDRTKLMRADDDHASRVIEVKVLNDPDGKVKENMQQEWLVLPNDVQDEWKAYQDLKSQSQLTENNSFSNQTPADQNSKPSTELINHMEHKQNAKEHICNVFSASSPADPSVIELMQSPSRDPTSVKIITDNYHYNSVLETSTSCPNLSDRTEKRSRFHIRKAFSRGNLTSLFAELQARDLAEPKDQHLDQSNAQDLGLSLTESSELPEDMKDKTKNTTTEAFEESSQNKSVLGEVVNRSNLTSLFAELQARDLTESKDQDLAQSNAEDLGLSLTEASEVPEDMTDKTNNTTTEDVEESNQNKSVLAVVIKNDLPKKTLTNTLVKIPFKRDEEGRWTKLAAESMNTQRQMSLKKISSNTHIDSIIHPPPSPINKTVVVLKPKEISKAIMGVSFADLTRKHQWQPTKVVY